MITGNRSRMVLVLLLLSLLTMPLVMGNLVGNLVDVIAGSFGLKQELPVPNNNILLVGDSHLVNYGESLHTSIQNTGYHTYIYGCSGTRAVHFIFGLDNQCSASLMIKDVPSPEKNNLKLTADYFKNLFDEINPSVIIFSFGTNYLNGAGVNADKNSIDSLLDSVKDRKCFWVGAPVSNQANVFPTEINANLKHIIGTKCNFIDSSIISGLTYDQLPAGGSHFYPGGYKIWADALYNTLFPLLGFVFSTSSVDDIGEPQVSPAEERLLSNEEPVEPSQTSSVTTIVGTSVCNNLCIQGSQCKQIDDAWRIVVSSFSRVPHKTDVWCPSQKWESYDNVYLPESKVTTTSTSQTDDTPASGDYSKFINNAAKTVKVPPKLVAGFIRYESGKAGPNAQSATGCRGLMGVCNWDTNYANFKAEYQYPNINIKNEPFDPEANIYIGSYILSLKYKVEGCKDGDDKIKCVIASYNAGEGLINYAAKKVSPGGEATWEDIIDKLQDEDFVKNLKAYSDERSWKSGTQKWTDSQNCNSKATTQNRRMCKMYNLRAYVNNVFNSVA